MSFVHGTSNGEVVGTYYVSRYVRFSARQNRLYVMWNALMLYVMWEIDADVSLRFKIKKNAEEVFSLTFCCNVYI